VKRTQWIVAGAVLLLTLGIYAVTQDDIFGAKSKQTPAAASVQPGGITIDSILHHAKEALSPEQVARINFLENSITRGDVTSQKEHVYHQLARFWKDTARIFEPYAWYTGEAARLENSEKSLTFAAHLFLDNLQTEESPALKQWKGLQAKDLFERSLKLNPESDSAQVGLGATYLFGGISDNPMEGLTRIRQVADKDSNNVYAQLTLGRASMMSNQVDRAIVRYQKVVALDPKNVEAILTLADIYERKGDNKQAVQWYRRSLALIEIPALRGEVEKRIAQLSK
jgi:tetratricopeptide (TPR) repeat protein